MKNLLVFDLKNTLITNDGDWVLNSQLAIKLAQKNNFALMLYSMNEPWSYRAIARWEREFAAFEKILLVKTKRPSDLSDLDQYNTVAVIGDSLRQELLFAKQFGYPCFQVTKAVPLADVTAYMKKLSS